MDYAQKQLTLLLFVLRILTDYSDASFSFDNFAFFANWFNWWSNLQRQSLLSKKSVYKYTTNYFL